MDLSPIVMPGVQNIVTAMLGDAWTATRDLIARRLGHGDADGHGGEPGAADGHKPAAEPESGRVSRELDLLRTRSLEPFANAEPDRRFLEGFWYCYVTRMLDEHPGLADVLTELVAGPGEPRTSLSVVSNINSGEVGRLLQNSGDIHGGVTMK